LVTLENLGFSPALAAAFAETSFAGGEPGRVSSSHTHVYRVMTADGERLAEISGRLRHTARGTGDYPAVGDWVVFQPRVAEERGFIHAVLPRRTAFVRRAPADREADYQVLAANLDTVFLMAGLDRDFNPRRIERGLILAWESGARPVVLLNKTDRAPDAEGQKATVVSGSPNVPVHLLSARHGTGIEALAPYLGPGQTVVLLGSSGVGKSTLVNHLLGVERQRIGAVREIDQRGRHTTTHRELVVLPTGGLLIDTPGLREIQLWGGGDGLEATFSDLVDLGQGCKFRDCAHGQEPGCAVRAATEDGRLAPQRLASYHKLQAELRHLSLREDPAAQRAEKERWRSIHKAARKHNPRG
jgi:ribosome biogenesis GTPase / thiamine phosphate phosphatase